MGRLEENLRRLRRLRGWRQREAGEALGMTRAAYANYENGLRSPKPEVLLRLAKLYQVSVDALLGHEAADINALAPQEALLLEKYRLLAADARAHFLRLVELEAALEETNVLETQKQHG